MLVAEQLRRYRQMRGMSAQEVADACNQLGFPLKRSVLANLESGRRTTVTVAELLVLARVLGVAPTMLVFPVGYEETVEVLPGQRRSAWAAARWFTGRGPFPRDDDESSSSAELQREPPADPIALYTVHDGLLADWQRETRRLLVLRQLPEVRDQGLHAEQMRGTESRLRDLEDRMSERRADMRKGGFLLPPLPPELAHLDYAGDDHDDRHRRLEGQDSGL